ncbi:MAG TPA: hypothetical protein VEG38_02030, partial [Acidimicrobiia bacterium]|nr:hypothetical protein [Acidimicrobiia bacterium]
EPEELGRFIGGSVSPKEVEDRIGQAKELLYNSPVETRQELNRVYGLDEGEAVAFILDPTNQRVQERLRAAAVGGASRRSGFGLLTQAEMEQLAASGVTEAAAGQRFGELAQIGEGLFAETAEESATGSNLGRETQIGYAGGSAEAERQMTQRRQRRGANFQGGGGAASGQGRTGLG